jgi:rfaE bifunctional protein kinase chain/domain
MNAGAVLDRFSDLRVAVAGDVCLDLWCQYEPLAAMPSRETGLPRVAVVSAERTPGAGGTVANNLVALGAGRVAVLGVIGVDGHGHELREALARRGVDASGLIASGGVQTFTYTKLLNRGTGAEDLPRIDWINQHPLPREAETRFVASLREAAAEFDLMIVSDQAETEEGGVITAAAREELARLARETGLLIWVDSRRRIEHYSHAVLKPNEDEAADALTRTGLPDLESLRQRAQSPGLIVTRGGRGARVYDGGGSREIPGRQVAHPVDICGAGDSFSAAAACALAVSGDLDLAAHFGNLAASLTIMQRGTGVARADELRRIAT